MYMKFFFSRQFLLMRFIKIISFAIRLKYFISPFFIVLPCLIIFQNLALADVKPKLINSGTKCWITTFDNFKHYSGRGVVNRVKINQDGKNVGDKLSFCVSDDHIVTNVVNPSPSNDSRNYSSNGRSENGSVQHNFWFWLHVFLLSTLFAVVWIVILIGAGCFGFYMAKWWHGCGFIYTISIFTNWLVNLFSCRKT